MFFSLGRCPRLVAYIIAAINEEKEKVVHLATNFRAHFAGSL